MGYYGCSTASYTALLTPVESNESLIEELVVSTVPAGSKTPRTRSGDYTTVPSQLIDREALPHYGRGLLDDSAYLAHWPSILGSTAAAILWLDGTLDRTQQVLATYDSIAVEHLVIRM